MNSIGILTAEFHSHVKFECQTVMATSVEIPEPLRKNTLDMAVTQVVDVLPLDGTNRDKSSQIGSSPSSSPGGTSLASSPALPTESASITTTIMNPNFMLRDNQEDLSSPEDSRSAIYDAHSYQGEHEEMSSPLAQLQCALEKNGMLGMKLTSSSYSSDGDIPGVDGERNGMGLPPSEKDGTEEVYHCHICNYSGTSKFHFNSHMNTHYEYKCPMCDYTSRTEGRLKRHVKDFHKENSQENCNGSHVPSDEDMNPDIDENTNVNTNSSGSSSSKQRNHRCKQCTFVAINKNEFWEHSKSHIKAEKLLTCPRCNFVTEYKHHLEYHLRNHFGSKPFKCNKCNYTCVNKSMLNSHMKSHSNVYQYRCSECSYATKYCHSLKLHLRKYAHKPSTVLNIDGSPNPFPVIDIYGSRRGPRPKKQKQGDHHNNITSTMNAINGINPVVSQSSVTYHNPSIPPLIPNTVGMPFMYPPPPQFVNGCHGNVFIRPHAGFNPPATLEYRNLDSVIGNGEQPSIQCVIKCNLCDFSSEKRETFNKHMLLHAAAENQDLCKLYGINSDSLFQFHDQTPPVMNNLSKKFNESDCRVYDFNNDAQVEEKSIKHSPAVLSRSSESNSSEGNDLRFNGNGIPDKSPSSNQAGKSMCQVDTNSPKQHLNESLSPVPQDDQQSSGVLVKNDGMPSVIVSLKSPEQKPKAVSLNSSADSSLTEGNSNSATSSTEEVAETSSPLDLSSTSKSVSTIKQLSSEIASDQEERSFPTAEVSPSNSSTPVHSRNRRKGKAFKLNRLCLMLHENESSFKEYSLNSSPPSQTAMDTSEEQITEPQLPQYEKKSPNNPITINQPQTQISTTAPQPPVQSSSLTQFQFKQQEILSLPQSVVHNRLGTFPTSNGVLVPKTVPQSSRLDLSYQIPHSQVHTPVYSEPNGYTNSHKSNFLLHCKPYPSLPFTAPSLVIPENSVQYSQKEMQNHSVPQIHKDEDIVEVKKLQPNWRDIYSCNYCDMAFKDCVMYTMHMGYHGYRDPFTCNMCGQQSKDKVSFFLHIARTAHM